MRYRIALKTLSILSVGGILFIAGCSGINATSTPTLEPELEEAFTPVVSATGVVIPMSWSLLSMPVSGVVAEVIVAEGDLVEAGQLLIGLDGREQLEANLAQARLELVNAQHALDAIYEGADVVTAQVAMALAEAQDDLKDADYKRTVRQEGNRASDATLDAAQAKLEMAEDSLDRAKARYDANPNNPALLLNYANAQQAYNSELRNWNWYTGHPTEIQQAQLDAEVALAEAQLAQAEMEWERVKNGPDPKDLEAAEARLANAEAQVAAAEDALNQIKLTAPFTGIVSELHIRPNEWIAPGQPVLLLADLDHLHVETTDLSEIDVARIERGNKVIVTFDALPDVVVAGTVTQIAPKAAEGAGVNYTVIIQLEGIPDKVRWGMTAFVDIEIGS